MGNSVVSEGFVVGERWRIGQLLGEGGFGQVFKAFDESAIGLGDAAVKIMHPNTSPLERNVFVQEVQRMAALRHQNLVGYLDSGQIEVDGHVYSYLVSEYCHGALNRFVAEQPDRRLTVAQTWPLLNDVCAGLRYLHGKQMVHRDIKPANVMYGDGSWKLGDFGLTRDLTATGSYHRGESLRGTPLYMSPELFSSSTATAASDIYAVGVLAHICLTGLPLHEGSGQALFTNIATQPPTIHDGLPPAVRGMIEACVNVDPKQRATVLELQDLLDGRRSASPSIQTNAEIPLDTTQPGAPTMAYHQDERRAPGSTGFAASQGVPTSQPLPGSQPQPTSQQLPTSQSFPTRHSLSSDQVLPTAQNNTSRYPADRVVPPVVGSPQAFAPAAPKRRSRLAIWAVVALVALPLIFIGILGLSVLAVRQGSTGFTESEGGDQPGVEIVVEPTAGATDSDVGADGISKELDGSGHLVGGCGEIVGGVGIVTNQHSAPVDYRIEVSHFTADGVRVDEDNETVQALEPGASSQVHFTSTDESAVVCRITNMTVVETNLGVIDAVENIELISCQFDGTFSYDTVLEVTNPSGSTPADVEVYVAVVNAEGVRVDEDWAGANVFDVPVGGTAREEPNITLFDVGDANPAPSECVVIAAEYSF